MAPEGAAAASTLRAAGRRVLAATRLVGVVQARGYFPHAFGVFAGVCVALLLWVFPEALAAQLLPTFLVGEPGILGFSVVAAYTYMERERGSAEVVLVSPVQPGEYALALLGASALLATVAACVTFGVVVGVDARLAWLILVMFPFAMLSGALGLALSLAFADFPRFLLGSVAVIVAWQAPLLAVYDLVPPLALVWMPSTPAILAVGELCEGDGGAWGWLALAGLLASVLGVGLACGFFARHERVVSGAP